MTRTLTKAQRAALEAIARGQVVRRLPFSAKPPYYAPPAGIRPDTISRVVAMGFAQVLPTHGLTPKQDVVPTDAGRTALETGGGQQ